GSAEAVYLVQELVRRGHDVHLFCPYFPDAEKVIELFADPAPSGPSKSAASTGPGSAQGPLRSERGGHPPQPGPFLREGGEGARGTGEGATGKLQCHLFTTWQMGRYTALRNFKYLAYPF